MYKGNFKFMLEKSCCSDTLTFAMEAEQHLYSNPTISAIKSLSLVEIILKKLCNQFLIKPLEEWNLNDILNSREILELINKSILELTNEINHNTNYLIEYEEDLDDDYKDTYALEILKKAYIVAYWFYTSFNVCSCPFEEFQKPPRYYIHETFSIEDALYEYKIIKSNNYKLSSYINVNKADFKVQNNEIAYSMGFTEEQTYLNDIFKGYELTNSQKNAISNLDDFFNDQSQKVFLLKGYGGTGKTFLTKGITDYLEEKGINSILAAPTGKAAKVIQNKTNKVATTIHKAIYNFKGIYDDYKDERKIDTFKIFFNIDDNNIQPSNTVFIFDEASMIGNNYQKNEFFRFGSSELLNDLIKFTNIFDEKFNNKIIFIGDTAQLPPIGMKTSPALDANYFYEKFNMKVNSCELTDVVRQEKQSGILINSINLREQMLNKEWLNGVSLDFNFEDINEIDEKDLITKYVDSCDGKISDDSIIIASKNELVDNYNTLVRDYFFPNKRYITVGDKVMAIENCRNPDFPIYNGDYGYVQTVDDDIIQRDVTVRTKIDDEVAMVTIPLRFKRVQIEFMGINQPFIIETFIFESILYRNRVYENTSFKNDIKKYVLSDSDIATIEKKALYLDISNRAKELGIKSDKKKFIKFMAEDPYYNSLKIKFGYAITCHKAQGSEWKNVFLNCNYHNKYSLDYLRWLYTAITRSTKNLYLINPPIG